MKTVTKLVCLLLTGALLVSKGQAQGTQPVGFEVVQPSPLQPNRTFNPGARPLPVGTIKPGSMSVPPDDLHGFVSGPATATLVREVKPAPAALPSPLDVGPAQVAPPESPVTLLKVNNKHIQFNYDLTDVGPSGVGGVEIWYTCDGKTWQKSDKLAKEGSCSVDVDQEGGYGFVFLARTGFGGGKEPPRDGDTPQIWVEVDLTRPVVSLTCCQLDTASRSLQIGWTATDRNLARKPISLSFAEQSEGPWTPFAINLENTGHYQWPISPGTPHKFWIRVEAADSAGNVGGADSSSPVLIDVSQPKVTNIRVNGAGSLQ